MLRNLLLLLAGTLWMSLSFSQSETENKIVGTSKVIKESPELSALADKVNLSYAAFAKSAAGSRTEAATARSEYESALSAYLTAMENEQTLNRNSSDTEELKREIDTVKNLQNSLNGTITK